MYWSCGTIVVVERPGLLHAVDGVDAPVDEDPQLGVGEPGLHGHAVSSLVQPEGQDLEGPQRHGDPRLVDGGVGVRQRSLQQVGRPGRRPSGKPGAQDAPGRGRRATRRAARPHRPSASSASLTASTGDGLDRPTETTGGGAGRRVGHPQRQVQRVALGDRVLDASRRAAGRR